MKKILLLFLLLVGLFFLFPEKILAITPESCSWTLKDANGKAGPPFERITAYTSGIQWIIGKLTPGDKYEVYTVCSAVYKPLCTFAKTADSKGQISGSFTFSENQTKNDIIIKVDELKSVTNPVCTKRITANQWFSQLSPTPKANASCKLDIEQNGKTNPSPISSSLPITIKGTIINTVNLSNYIFNCASSCNLSLAGPSPAPKTFSNIRFGVNTSGAKTFSFDIGTNWPKGTYSASAKVGIQGTQLILPPKILLTCSVDFNVGMPGGVVTRAPTPRTPYPSLAPLCNQLPGQFQVDCKNCVERQGKIWTAIGCISPDLGSFISQQLLGIGVGIGGGIAFLYFLYGAFLYLTSQGNPEQIAMAREIIMSALLGLLLIIFSVFLLRVISVDILKLPGFS